MKETVFNNLSKMFPQRREVQINKESSKESAAKVSSLLFELCDIDTSISSTINTLHRAIIDEENSKELIFEALRELNRLKKTLL